MDNQNNKSHFTLTLPRKIKVDDRIQVIVRLRNKPKIFRLLLGVKNTEDKKLHAEPKMIAFEFKVTFQNDLSQMKCTTNWKTDTEWQQETVVDASDWIDAKGLINLTLQFDRGFVDVFDNTSSLVTRFELSYEYSKINRLQMWGDILKLKSIALKYDNYSNKSSRSSRN